MQITVEKLPKSQVKIIIELSPEDHQKQKTQVLKKLNEQAKIPGFRSGHIPPEILEQKIGKEAIQNQIIDTALPQTYADAVMEKEIQVVAKPKIEILSQEPLKYAATVAVLPEVKVGAYQKIKIPAREVKVETKEVEDIKASLKTRHAEYKEVDRAAKKGDKAEIDFQGFDEGGAALDKTDSKNHPLIIGEGSLIPGFEDNLIGMKTSEEKEFDLTFPKDYQSKNFQNKKVKFKVKLNKVFEVILPELDEKFLEKFYGEKKSIKDFEEEIEKSILEQKKREEKISRENQFLEKLVGLTEAEIPDDLIEEEIDDILHHLQHQFQQQGIDFQKYLATLKEQKKDIRAEKRAQAEKQIKLRLALKHIFEQEKIDVDNKEASAEINKLLERYPEQHREELKKQYQEGSQPFKQVKNHLKLDKLFAKYI